MPPSLRAPRPGEFTGRCQNGAVPLDLVTSTRDELWDLLRDLLAAYAERRPVGRVAVVGNAPLLPDAERAQDIDACDLVIRMNSLKLDEPGDPPCLGTACHVVLLSRATRMTRWSLQDYRRRLYLVPQTGFTLFRTLRDLPMHWPADLGAIPVPNGAVSARIADRLDPEREPGSLLPTSGMIALFLAHELFPDAQTVATGFSFLSNRAQSEWAHHSGGSTTVNARHQLELEGALLESWIADGSVRFYE